MAQRGATSRILRWVIGIVVVVVALIVVAAIVLPMVIPKDTIRERSIAAVHDATGRDLKINGDLSVSVFPSLAVAVKDVTFSNASWAGSTPMASIAKLDLRLRVLPLLSGNIEVKSFVLEKPVIDLQTDKSGHGNWEFAAAASPPAAVQTTPTKPAAKEAPAKKSGSGSSDFGMNEIGLGDVRIVDGTISYRDGVTGKTETAQAVNFTISLPDLDSPLALTGSMRWRDKDIRLAINAAKPRALLAGAGSQIGLKLTADPIKLTYAGELAVAGSTRGSGDVDLSIPSMRDLIAWSTGRKSTIPGDGLGPFSLKGKVAIDGAKYALNGIQIGLDGANGTGDLAVDTGGAVPALKGKLSVDKLDLNHYMAPAADEKGGAAPAASGKTESAKSGGAQPGSAQAPQGWSDEPIDASGLKSANVNLALEADAIFWRKVQVGKTEVQITLESGRLTLDLTNMAIYQGKVTGRVQVDGSSPILATDANLKIDKVQVQPLLKAMADSDRISGAAIAETQLSAKGKSQRELIGTLGGKGQFSLLNGVVRGVDLVGIVRNAAASVVGGSGGETDFTTASGTYTVTNGILTNKDLTVSAPTLSSTGAGTLDLPKRSVDYKLVASLVGTVAVPIDVKGPWDNIGWNVDMAALVKQNVGNAGKLVGSGVKGVGSAVGSAASGLGGLTKKLFGN